MSASPSDPLATLLSAVRDLQVSVDSLSARLAVIEEKLGVEADHWELVEEAFDPPSRVTFGSPVARECPEIPAALLSFAERLASSAPGHIVRAKRAFEAGFRAKQALVCDAWYYGASTTLPFKDTVWIVLKAPGSNKTYRVSIKSDISRLAPPGAKGDWIVQGFPSLTEAQIFCAGADVPVPPLYRWKKQQ